MFIITKADNLILFSFTANRSASIIKSLYLSSLKRGFHSKAENGKKIELQEQTKNAVQKLITDYKSAGGSTEYDGILK